MTAAECICELMTSLTHFNYRNNIFTVVVSMITTHAIDNNKVIVAVIENKTDIRYSVL